MKLGVNIDHVAVLREARAVNDPDILEAMFVAIAAGADQITTHLREDRRHINDIDAENIINLCKIPVNMECSVNPDIIDIVAKLRPSRATLVPENRAELTTEGGLNLSAANLKEAIKRLSGEGIEVSLFIDPNIESLQKSADLGVKFVELHTGAYANAFLMLNSNLSHTKYAIKSLNLPRTTLKNALEAELEKLAMTSEFGANLGVKVAAGHGLNYQNVSQIARIQGIFELNIGQSIIARSVFSGLGDAVREMKRLID